MCHLLHIKKEYSCQHEVLEQREKVDCGQRNCALSDLAHKLDKNHTLKECRETCNKRMGPTQEVIMARVAHECNACRMSF